MMNIIKIIMKEKSLSRQIFIECVDFEILEKHKVNKDEISKDMSTVVELIFESENVDICNIEVSLSFVSPNEIKALNRDYRGNDKETDVLSFPQYENVIEIQEEIAFAGEIDGVESNLFLGDVVISLDKVQEQSEEYNHSFQRELMYLFVHSILHLLGFDHMIEGDKKIMRKKEKEIMKELNKYER